MEADRTTLEKAEVLENRQILPQHFWMNLKAPSIAQGASPGQFLTIRIPSPVALLPRPMSLSGIDASSGVLSILYRVVGLGTSILSGLCPGESLDLMGPLGQGFPSPPPGALLVAGGTGIAPLLPLAQMGAGDMTLLYGARSQDQLIDLGSIVPSHIRLELATDDGSRGHQGTVPEALQTLLEELKPHAIYVCGPRPMMAQVASQARKRGIPAWVSLEERMACGVGACLGCAIQTPAGYRRVCKDGPVFRSEEVTWDDQA